MGVVPLVSTRKHRLLFSLLVCAAASAASPAFAAEDCAPLVPGISALPGSIGDTLRVNTFTETTLSWNRATQGATSNIYVSGTPSDFSCLVAETPELTFEDTATPASGELFYYLVNARNVCGDGPLDSDATVNTCATVSGDADLDAIPDLEDNCPLIANSNQHDGDQDGIGDLCDTSVISDDFNKNNLNPTLWGFLNPLDDATLAITGTGTADAHLEISIPPGSSHDPWTSNDAARVMQYASDIDFQLEAKFESPLTERYQTQGIMIEGSPDRFIRFDFWSDNGNIVVFAASSIDNIPTAWIDITVPDMAVQYMRVTRIGDMWTMAYSDNGVGWTVLPAFEVPLVVTSVGVFAANFSNSGSDAAAHTAIIDYFFNISSPLVPEDLAPPLTDYIPPFMHNESFGVGATSVLFDWNTDEPATSLIDYGLTIAYELGFVEDTALVYGHHLAADGLDPDTTYHFRLGTTDFDDNVQFSSDYMITTQPQSQSTPLLDIWYGLNQQFGQVGQPQTWVNLLGNVSDPDGINSLTYSLNGGPDLPLSLGPDGSRLQAPGDFNADIDVADLFEGPNQVAVTAEDNLSEVSFETIDFVYSGVTTWPETFSVDWSTVTDLTATAQPVDGLWTITSGTVAPAATGYDRLLAIGDITWTDYEVTAPITINAIDPAGSSQSCNCYAIGFLLRWTGHAIWDSSQPALGYFPLGAIAGYRWDLDNPAGQNGRLWLAGNEYTTIGEYVYDNSGRTLTPGTTYTFKARVETTPGPGGSLYSLKIWEEGTGEPLDWDLTLQTGAEDHPNGSLLLLAHYVDATFGNVTITPLNP
jgi:regulation of enolase protein 1 (concanavalin A-like superfamily)